MAYDQAPVDAGYSQPGSKRFPCKVGRIEIALPLSSLNAIVREKQKCGIHAERALESADSG